MSKAALAERALQVPLPLPGGPQGPGSPWQPQPLGKAGLAPTHPELRGQDARGSPRGQQTATQPLSSRSSGKPFGRLSELPGLGSGGPQICKPSRHLALNANAGQRKGLGWECTSHGTFRPGIFVPTGLRITTALGILRWVRRRRKCWRPAWLIRIFVG